MHPPNFEVNEWFYGLRNDWKRLLRTSKSPAAATTAILKLHSHDFNKGDPDRDIFWLMLAYYQCEDECLQPLTRRRALAIIRRGAHRIFWTDGRPSTARRRQADFDRLLVAIERAKPSTNSNRQNPKRESPKRKNPKRKSPKRKSPKRKSPKRKSPK
jgi:hypothetical protein